MHKLDEVKESMHQIMSEKHYIRKDVYQELLRTVPLEELEAYRGPWLLSSGRALWWKEVLTEKQRAR